MKYYRLKKKVKVVPEELKQYIPNLPNINVDVQQNDKPNIPKEQPAQYMSFGENFKQVFNKNRKEVSKRVIETFGLSSSKESKKEVRKPIYMPTRSSLIQSSNLNSLQWDLPLDSPDIKIGQWPNEVTANSETPDIAEPVLSKNNLELPIDNQGLNTGNHISSRNFSSNPSEGRLQQGHITGLPFNTSLSNFCVDDKNGNKQKQDNNNIKKNWRDRSKEATRSII